MGKLKRLVAVKVIREDWEYVRNMQTVMVMRDGKARGLPVVLHTIIQNARELAGDELLTKEEGKE